MSHHDGLLDPVLQPAHGHHPQQQSHHSIQDIQASQILSHFQFAPAGSPAAAAQAAAAATGNRGSAQPTTHDAGQQQGVYESLGAFPAVGDVVGSDVPGSTAADQPVDGLAHHQHAPDVGYEGAPQQQQQQQHPGRPLHQHQQQQMSVQQQHGYGHSAAGVHPHRQIAHAPAAHHPQQQQHQYAPPASQQDASLKRTFDTYASSHAAVDDDGAGSDGDSEVDRIQDLAALRREVKQLRRTLRANGIVPGSNVAPAAPGYASSQQHPTPGQDYYVTAAAAAADGPSAAESSSAGARRAGGARKVKRTDDYDEDEKRKRNALTGKRETTPRHHALNKAIRDRMKELMGVGSDERLPSPHDPQPALVDGYPPTRQYHRPDWKAGVKNEANKAWLEGVARDVIEEAWNLTRGPQPSVKESKGRIPNEDLEFDLAFKAARTSFANFTKKWVSQTDPVAMQKAIVDAKRGRRWARKDLKQRKRSKAALDENYASLYGQQPHPHILKLDYMSSECSSEGDDAGLDHGPLPEGQWEVLSGRDPDPALNKGKGEKVLEIRTPRWRSERLTEILNNLDEIASLQAKAVKGNFYTAPALKRFKLHPLRDLPIPSVDAPLEAWEFDPAWLAQPTNQVDEIRRKLGMVSIRGAGQQQPSSQVAEPAMDQFGGMMVGGYGMDIMGGLEGYAQGEGSSQH